MIRLIVNDFKSNKLITASTCVFMTITAMLLGLAIFLFASLWTSIDSLMKKAETPHFLQMHTGELKEAEIETFAAARDDVEEGQIARFLNLQNSLTQSIMNLPNWISGFKVFTTNLSRVDIE